MSTVEKQSTPSVMEWMEIHENTIRAVYQETEEQLSKLLNLALLITETLLGEPQLPVNDGTENVPKYASGFPGAALRCSDVLSVFSRTLEKELSALASTLEKVKVCVGTDRTLQDNEKKVSHDR